MTHLVDWPGVLSSRSTTRAYTESLEGTAHLAVWLYLVELVACTRHDPQDSHPDYFNLVYLGSHSHSQSHTPAPLRLPQSLVDTLARDPEPRASIQAALVYLSAHSSPPPPATPTTVSLSDQAGMLLSTSNDRLVHFPRPPSSSLRATIVETVRELSPDQAADSIAAVLVTHYTAPEPGSTPGTPPSPCAPLPPPVQLDKEDDDDNDDDEEDNSDTRSIQTGIKEARESIVRKEDKLRWLLGDNFQKGPSCRSSSAVSSPTTSQVGSTTSLSTSTIRRPVSTTPTPSRIFSDETTSTVGELPEFPSARALSDQRDSVDSFASSHVDSQRHLRLVSTSSSTAPLLASSAGRPSTGSINRDAPPPLPASSVPHRRVLSTGVLPASSTAYSFSQLDPLTSPGLPTPPLQPHDDSPSSRPFAYLHDLPSPRNNKRNSLDSAKDDLKHGRRESIPLDCQELSDREKSELVRRSKKLEKLLGGHFGGTGASNLSPRRRGNLDDTDSARTRRGDRSGDARGEAGFDRERRHARPVAIAIPSVRLGAAVESPASVSPTTVVPGDEKNELSSTPTGLPRDSGPPAARDCEPRPTLMQRSSSTPPYSPSSSSSTSPKYRYPTDERSVYPDLYLARTNSSTATTLSTIGSSGGGRGGSGSSRHRAAAVAAARPRIAHSSSSNSTSSSSAVSIEVEREREREERRRKLEKVRRVLGERVPVNLVVETKPILYEDERYELSSAGGRRGGGGGHDVGENDMGGGGGGVGMGKSKSRMMGDKLKEVFKHEHFGANGVGPTAAATAGSGGGGARGKKWLQDRENWVGTRSAPQLGGLDRRAGGQSAGGPGGGGVQGVEALTKARKLESLFGDLPPQALYLAPTPVHPPSRHARAPPLKHRRSRSDIGASRSPSVSTGSSAFGGSTRDPLDLDLDLDLDLCRSRSNGSSLQSYRQSIASLRYVIEEDPGALDEVVRAYTDGAGTRGTEADSTWEPSSSALEPPDPASTSTTTTMITRPVTASTTSQAAVRKAQKLSSFFGTTKGEVWKRLLDDIRTAVEEDEELEVEERQEVLDSLDKLNQGVQQEH